MENLEILIAVAVIAITCLLILFYLKKKSSRRAVLLMGLSDSGKTLIFSKIIYNKYIQTHTSMKENVADYAIGNHVLKLVDVPGYERLRLKYFDQYKNVAKGLVFVIDSATVQKDVKDVAEFLYTILSDDGLNTKNILILCNKQDIMSAKGSGLIRNLLEKELNTVLGTKANQLEAVNSQGRSKNALDKLGNEFSFSALRPVVDFGECTAYDPDSENHDLSHLEKWLESIA